MNLPQAFWRHVEPRGGCWEWTGAHNSDGYGLKWVGPKREMAHRVAWTLLCGPIPEGSLVLHRCDNPPCVRPLHLFLGSQSDNIRDRDRKGRRVPNQRGAWRKGYSD